MIISDTQIASWSWALPKVVANFVEGSISLNSGLVADGQMANIYLSVNDRNGVSRLNELQAIGLSTRITLDSKPPSSDSYWDLEFSVSGLPYYSSEYFGSPSIGHYVIPVKLNRIISAGSTGENWDNTLGDQVDVSEVTYGPSKNTVEYVQDTILTTWDASTFTSRNDRWDTREGDIRKEIYKMTQAKHNISFIYKESLRSMIASFNDVGYIDSEEKFNSIMCIHANAERAIAKLKQENNIILPIISIGQTVSDNDSSRQKTESLLVNEKYWDAKKNKAYRILSLAPRAVNVKYQVNIWTKYMSDMDQILEQIRLKFNPEMQVPTEFSTLAKAYLDSEDDVGQISVADKEDRVLKKTMNIVLRTYIPSPKFLYTSTGKIEEFKVETS
tara:strand:- start:1557 stop:2717 length:1161 start_codon:yes stop_codon:yes gene_type:complete